MNKLKELMEKRANLISELNQLNEERKFDEFNEKDKELRDLEKEIETEKRMIELTDGTDEKLEDENGEEDELAQAIREACSTGKEIDVSNYEIRDGEMAIGTAPSGGSSVGNIRKKTFAETIIKRLPEISSLYNSCRHVPLPSSNHAIPIQRKRLGKFVKMKELENYVKDTASYDQIEVKSHKYGTLVVVSDELVEDTGYDLVSDIKEQIQNAAGETIDSLLVTGDEDCDGLNSFVYDSEAGELTAKETKQTVLGAITIEEITKLYFSLPKKERKNATWVFSDDTARLIDGLVDENGRSIVKNSYNGAPFGEGSLLLGRPVIVNDNVANLDSAGAKSIFFGNLDRALVVAPRKSLTLKKSDEYGFINDSKAIKANMRLDIKIAVPEAMAYFKNHA